MSWNQPTYATPTGRLTAEKLAQLQTLENSLKSSIHDPPNIDSYGFGLPPKAKSWPADFSPYHQDKAPEELLSLAFDQEKKYSASRQAFSLYPRIDSVEIRLGSVMETGVDERTMPSYVKGVPDSACTLDCRAANFPTLLAILPPTDGYSSDNRAHVPLAQFRKYPELLNSILCNPPASSQYSTMQCGFMFGRLSGEFCQNFQLFLSSPRVATHALMLILESDLGKLNYQPGRDQWRDYEGGSLSEAWAGYIETHFTTDSELLRTKHHLSILDKSPYGWCIALVYLDKLEILKFPLIPKDDNRGIMAYPPEYPCHLLREQCYYDWCRYFYPDRVRI